MKTNRFKNLLLAAVLLGGATAFYSCSKDDNNDPLPKEDADQLIAQADGDFVSTNQVVMDNDGIKVLLQLNSMGLPEIPDKAARVNPGLMFKSSKQLDRSSVIALQSGISPELAKAFQSIISYGITDYEGVWTWTPNGWSFEPSSAHSVVLKFPYPLENTTNNATLTLYDYQTTLIEDYEEITALKAKVELGSVTVLSLTYASTYFPTQSFDLTAEFGGYKLSVSIDYSDSSSEIYSLSKLQISFKQGNTTLYALDLNLNVSMISETNTSVKLNATLIMKSLKFTATADFNTDDLDYETNPNVDLNEYISVKLYTTSDREIGHFSFVRNFETGELTVKFIYADGTEVNAEELMPQISAFIQSLLEEE